MCKGNVTMRILNAQRCKNDFHKSKTLPFDWMFATPSFVYEMLVLLLEKNIDIDDLVKNHFLYCEKRANYREYEHYYTCNNGFAMYNTKYNVIFPHDNYTTENINKYMRRFERLKEIILNSSEELYFLYISQSSLGSGNFTIDGNIVVKDVYFHISNIYKLIGKFRSNYKVLLFDAIQEEQIELLDPNVIFHTLTKCNYRGGLLSEMNNFTPLHISNAHFLYNFYLTYIKIFYSIIL